MIGMKRLLWMAVLGMAVMPPVSAAAQSEGARDLFSEDDNGYYMARLTRSGVYEYKVTYSVFLKGNTDTVRIPTTSADDETPLLNVARLRSAASRTERPGLRVCVDEDCRAVPNSLLTMSLSPASAPNRIQISLSAREITGKEDVYLRLPAGLVQVQREENKAFGPSPAMQVLLPRFEEDNPMVGGPPLFRMDLSPLAREIEGGDAESITLDFEGGVRRFARTFRYGFTYNGSIAADEDLAFNMIQAKLELERNLLPRYYVPLLVTAGAESDQSFEVANAVVTIQGRGLLPIDVNYSPRDSGYIPNARPILTLRLEHGWNVRDETDSAPQDFTRPGYAVRWKVPIARNTVVRLDHDGRWSYGAFFDGAPEYHPMWDAGLEVRRGDVTYFLGYRRGEAPPVFREVKAVMAGLVFGVR